MPRSSGAFSPTGAPTLLLRAYRIATSLYAPFAYRKVTRKLRAQGVSALRIRERLGNASLPRSTGPLIWFHAASVGESLSVLGLITAMGKRLPGHEFLITSGTATSAELIAKRLPPRTRHQFAPLDATGPVRRFYARWTPVAGVFVESELWPVMLMDGRARGVPLALLNARLSQTSVKSWCKRPKTAAYMLDHFALMLTQNRATADNLLAMGGDPARIKVGRNLKSTAAALPVDLDLLMSIQRNLNGRPFWVASSTHPGEEEVVLQAHRTLLKQFPGLCLLLIPRHPERGQDLARMIVKSGLSLAMRSRDETLAPDTQVYLADTLGETGTWYALADLVFLGGSLKDIGGHNPFEPAISGAAVITGPYVRNFAETYTALISRGGAVEVSDAGQLAGAVAQWLTDKDAADTARTAARDYAVSQQDGLNQVVDQLCHALDLDPGNA
ncbi:MAG: 3-deoxy-D-manno-octulosonic acid transferase [Rhodobacteraceae bacterium]|nr:3-deoxy-D-manno-octulosonic acid transferase [Paracoccaceae bacterium]